MTIYKKLQEARIMLQNTKLTKSGKNKFAGYEYFELGDFLPAIQNICQKVGLCGVVAFTNETAYLTIHDVEDSAHLLLGFEPLGDGLADCEDRRLVALRDAVAERVDDLRRRIHLLQLHLSEAARLHVQHQITF